MINKLLVHTKQLIAQHHRTPKAPTIIIGLSGGPDSVFLLHVLSTLAQELPLNLIAAHLNHGWREEAGLDAQFCADLCTRYNIPLISTHAHDFTIPQTHGSKEAMGRALRRQFFQTVKTHYNADFIALGHHANDQQETFFIRMLRGSSLSGLVCMKAYDNDYLRPLLTTPKQAILDFLHTHQISYCIDQSNNSDEFLRNRIRKYVLPALTMCDARFDQNFASTLTHLQEAEHLLATITQEAYTAVFNATTPLTGSLTIFNALPKTLKHRVLLQLLCTMNVPFTPSSGYFEELTRFLASPTGGTHHVHQTWTLWKKQGKFGVSV